MSDEGNGWVPTPQVRYFRSNCGNNYMVLYQLWSNPLLVSPDNTGGQWRKVPVDGESSGADAVKPYSQETAS